MKNTKLYEAQEVKQILKEVIEERQKPVLKRISIESEYLNQSLQVLPHMSEIKLKHLDILLSASTKILSFAGVIFVGTVAINQNAINLDLNLLSKISLTLALFSITSMLIILHLRSLTNKEFLGRLEQIDDHFFRLSRLLGEVNEMKTDKSIEDVIAMAKK